MCTILTDLEEGLTFGAANLAGKGKGAEIAKPRSRIPTYSTTHLQHTQCMYVCICRSVNHSQTDDCIKCGTFGVLSSVISLIIPVYCNTGPFQQAPPPITSRVSEKATHELGNHHDLIR